MAIQTTRGISSTSPADNAEVGMPSGTATVLPDFAPIAGLEDGLLQIAVVRTALELDLFGALAAEPRTAEDLAAFRQISHRGAAVVLDALCAMGFVRKERNRYQLTETANAYLVPQQEGYYGDSLLRVTLSLDAASQLTRSVRDGEALAEYAEFENAGRQWAKDFQPAMRSWMAESEAAATMWEDSGIDIARATGLDILDVGCGAAVKTLTAARLNPQTEVVGFDKYREVLDLATQVAGLMGVTDKFATISGDLQDYDFGSERYDVVYSSAVLYFFANNNGLDSIFARIRESLKLGGSFVLNHRMPDNERQDRMEPLLLAVQLFLFHPASFVPTALDYEDALRRVGFTAVEQRRWDMLVAVRT